MMSKAELARKAGLSTLTIDRVEAGRPCRLDTKRKILLALGLKVSDKDRIFGESEDAPAESVGASAGGNGYAAEAAPQPTPTMSSGPSTLPNPAEGEPTR